MVDLKTAYKIAHDFFIEDGYSGVYEIRESETSWMFMGKCKKTCYGTSEICVPKDGSDPYLFSISHEDFFSTWKNAKIIFL